MRKTLLLKLVLGIVLPATFLIILIIFLFFYSRRRRSRGDSLDEESEEHSIETETGTKTKTEELVVFEGGEDLTISDILDSPGEVIGKSSYGTLYKATLQRNETAKVLRFLKPLRVARSNDNEFGEVVCFLGSVRHQNLVPLLGFYTGPRGETLLVHPFYDRGNLSQFIKDGNGESHKWTNIYKISIGIARGLDHLHTRLKKPIIHGNLKSKNILLDNTNNPCISDFGLHCVLSPNAVQEMVESSGFQPYKAPELIKMIDASELTDVYSFGVILLELVTGKESVNENTTPAEDLYLPNSIRNAVLDGSRISNLYRSDILLRDGESVVTEARVLMFFQLAMACCSPAPSLRPDIKKVLEKLEEIGKY